VVPPFRGGRLRTQRGSCEQNQEKSGHACHEPECIATCREPPYHDTDCGLRTADCTVA
jgi:hypothetical protein